ncbi:hypothetical protein D0C16_12335 [Cellvibrio sp. KY-GH-1]|uniref:DUF6249 domain-containing protein n=1 Tax=Cellvibrio sp. KY-GH-1 TaxID=2303332 RepID=UPI0012440D77|nr:DUF6249 domain-containing protein [Cellvibrio sp. KY-GH-1]QEY16685.1 hypothetical protein D0C16_12335 [Cellvibrio sp. KY-GH-1]
MTLLNNCSRRLGVLALASAMHLPALAAELEGTPVPVGSSAPLEVQTPLADPVPIAAPVPVSEPVPGNQAQSPDQAPVADTPPTAPPSDEHTGGWKQEHEQHMREMEQQMRDQEQAARDHEQHRRDGDNWQLELDKGLQEAFGEAEFDAGDLSVAILIPILAITFIFGGPIFLVCFLMLHHYRNKARRQQDINTNIDKLLAAGRDIPVELLRGDEPRAASDNGDLSRGIRSLFLGIGLLIFLTALMGFDIGAVGFILIGLGLSHILIWYLNKPKAGAEPQAGQQD